MKAEEAPAAPTPEASEESPKPAPRGRGRRGSRAAKPETATETPAENGAVAAEAPAPEAAPQPEGASETPRRSRGRRGGARRIPAAEAPATAESEQPERQERPEPQPRDRSRGRSRGGRPAQPVASVAAERAAAEKDAQVSRPRPGTRRPDGQAPPRRDGRDGGGRGGSVESLIARQNVLFEEFSEQQTQALRELQRVLSGRSGSSGGAGAVSSILPRVGVFLDVPNLIYAAEQMGVRVHFGKLLDHLTQGRQLVRATAYAPITDDPATRFEAQRFVAPVINQGYKVVTKPWKRFADGGMKANFDIELAVDILTMSDRLDIVVLLSGDSDFKRVLELVESKGVRVEVVAFAASTAAELRAVADAYVDLGSILSLVSA